MSYRDGWWDPRSESTAFMDREANRERASARRRRRARFDTVDVPLENVRWRGTWVGDCPDCGTRCVIGLGSKLEGLIAVKCPNEACLFISHYDYREALS